MKKNLTRGRGSAIFVGKRLKEEAAMVTAMHVSSFFVRKGIAEGILLDHLRIQKLIYFAQGFSLAYFDTVLFGERIYAWDFGPVVPEVYRELRVFGSSRIDALSGMLLLGEEFMEGELLPGLGCEQRKMLDHVWEAFKMRTAREMVWLTHLPGSPWDDIQQEYQGRPPRNVEIPVPKIKVYFKAQI